MSEALRLADELDAMWIDPALCHHMVAPKVERAADELRRLSAELEECQAQRRAAFRRIEELEHQLSEAREQQSLLRKALLETDAFKSAEITGAAMKGTPNNG